MPSNKKNKKSKKSRNKEKREAPAPRRNDNDGERLFAEAMMQSPEQVTSFLMSMTQAGVDPDEAMAQLMQSLQMRENGTPREAAAFDDAEKQCDQEECQVEGEYLCNGCKSHYYCSKDCQTMAWKSGGHKQQCKLLHKCRNIPSMPLIVAMGDSMTLGVARTKNHGNHVFAMEKYTSVGSESNRMVPLASVAFEGDAPSYFQVTTCLVNSILYPEFDTKTAGARLPCYVSIQSSSFGNIHVAQHLAAVCHRLGITVKDMGDKSTSKPKLGVKLV